MLTACGGSIANDPGLRDAVSSKAGSVYAEFAGMTGQQREDALVEAAKKEGEIVLYTSISQNDDLKKGFEEEYGIPLKIYRSQSEDVQQRVLQEASAGRLEADVVVVNQPGPSILSSEGIFAPYESYIRAEFPDQAKFKDWTAVQSGGFIVGLNTDVVSASERPRSILDLADPKWKGLISMEFGDWDWYAGLHVYLQQKEGMSEQEVDNFFDRLVANATIVKGHTVQIEQLSAGQFGVAVSMYKHLIDLAQLKDAPVTWAPPIEPILDRVTGVAVTKTAPHPAGALLLTDWLLTEGQEISARSYYTAVSPNVENLNPLPEEAEIYQIPESVYQDGSKWSTEYDQLIRGATQSDGGG